jgi:hypothetical protein
MCTIASVFYAAKHSMCISASVYAGFAHPSKLDCWHFAAAPIIPRGGLTLLSTRL